MESPESPLTLSDRQSRAFGVGIAWQFAGLGAMIGLLVSLLIPATRMGLSVVPVVLLIVFGVTMACFAIGVALLMRHARAGQRRLEESLDLVPSATAERVPAVLVRAIPSRRGAPHQLLYAVRTATGVGPIGVAMPAEQTPPVTGSGAWLLVDPANPDAAAFAPVAGPEEHATAAQDPALQRLSGVQRGTRLPGRAYLAPLLVGLAATAASFAVFSLLSFALPAN